MRQRRTALSATTAALVLALLGGAAPALGYEVKLSVETHQRLLAANRPQTAYLKIGLIGAPAPAFPRGRPPLNIALVLDRSGSMTGAKIEQAKAAAIEALERLGPQDVVSVVAYDTTVEVLVPATKLSDRHAVYRQIRRLEPRGTTALFAGVSKGAHEVLKFFARRSVNRVILLSDGLANVGPSSPGALARLGRSLAKDGISVTTIGLGLGYNEDLMYRLAGASDGNHVFVESAEQLAEIFRRELGDMFSVIASDVELRVRCAPGTRPLRILGRQGEIVGSEIRVNLNQVLASVEKYVLLEVELAAQPSGAKAKLAEVVLSYRNLVADRAEQQTQQAEVAFSDAADEVAQSANRVVTVAVAEQTANDASRQAVALRDAGRIGQAREVLRKSVSTLRAKNVVLNSKKLGTLEKDLTQAEEQLDKSDLEWRRARKGMRQQQRRVESQQSY